MYRNFAVTTIFVLLSGCVTHPLPIPEFPANEKKMDADGYYKYSTYWFKGKLKDGVPNGKGQCRTQYLTGLSSSEWVNSPCTFEAGKRIDTLHKKRSENSLVIANQRRADQIQYRKEMEEELEISRAEARREEQRSKEAFERNLAASLTNLNQQMLRDYQQMSGMVQKSTTPRVRTYTPSTSSYGTRPSGTSSSSSTGSSSRSSSASIATNSSGSNSNYKEKNEKTRIEREKNLQAQKLKKLEQQQANEAKLAKAEQEREKAEQQRQLQMEEMEKQRQIQLANEKREADKRAEKQRLERERLVQKQREEQEKAEYLSSLKRDIRLKARDCYGGNYVVGISPKRSSKLVSSIDVHYRAYCPGGGKYSGVSKNFIGIGTDCFTGDTVGNEIPKNVLSCKAEEMTVEVINVTSTR